MINSSVGYENSNVCPYVNQELAELPLGDIEPNRNDEVDILVRALEENDQKLIERCFSFLVISMDFTNIQRVLAAAVKYDHPELKWLCLRFSNIHALDGEFLWFLDNACLSAQEQSILEIGFKSQMIPTLTIEPLRKISIDGLGNYKSEIFELLIEIQSVVPIDNLFIRSDNVDNFYLLKLSKYLTTLTALTVRSQNLTRLPQSWLKTLKEIDCSYCPNLDSLDAENAHNIKTIECKNIYWIKAPRAEWIDAEKCPSLEEVDAPNIIEWINVPGPNRLKKLNVSRAEKIFAENCPFLVEVTAACARHVFISDNASLEYLVLPRVRLIYIYNCPNLKSIYALKAKNIVLANCEKLKLFHISSECDIRFIKFPSDVIWGKFIPNE